jgi:hypothetical protein
MSSRPLLSALLLCALSPPSLASYYPPPVPDSEQPLPYFFNLTRVDGLAPLLNMDSEARIKDSYMVAFEFDKYLDFEYNYDYPLDDHWAHLGQDLSKTYEFLKMRVGYSAKVEDVGLLERIRGDANVSFVQANRLIEPSGMPGTE